MMMMMMMMMIMIMMMNLGYFFFLDNVDGIPSKGIFRGGAPSWLLQSKILYTPLILSRQKASYERKSNRPVARPDIQKSQKIEGPITVTRWSRMT